VFAHPVREGALPEAFESGAASARGADPQGSAASRRWLRPVLAPVAADAAPSPPSQGGVSGSAASRSPARTWARRPASWRRPRPSGSYGAGPCGRT